MSTEHLMITDEHGNDLFEVEVSIDMNYHPAEPSVGIMSHYWEYNRHEVHGISLYNWRTNTDIEHPHWERVAARYQDEIIEACENYCKERDDKKSRFF